MTSAFIADTAKTKIVSEKTARMIESTNRIVFLRKPVSPIVKTRENGRWPFRSIFTRFAVAGFSSPVLLSEIIFPSFSSMILSPYRSAFSLSCDTTTMSLFCESPLSNVNKEALVSLSSAPVGSSARMISGSLMRARAIATRCFCPPESCEIFLSYNVLPSLPTSSTRRSTSSTS